MKKILLATSAIVALMAAAPAGAADIPVKARPLPPPPPACAQFGGFWLGAQVGWAKYDHQCSDKDAWAGAVDDDLVGDRRNSKGGFAGGIGAGYNWQSGCTVFGVSIDYNWSGINAENLFTDGEGAPTDTLTVSSRLRGYGTAMFRTGIVVDPAARGRGYAMKIVAVAARQAILMHGIARFRALTSSPGTLAIAHRLGFQHYGTNLAAYLHG